MNWVAFAGVGTKPESKPPCIGAQGDANATCVAVLGGLSAGLARR
jgi:hypothetical protein